MGGCTGALQAFINRTCAGVCCVLQDPRDAVANTVRSGSTQVDVVWRPSGLSRTAWPDVLAGPLTSKPLVLLVNSNTASASEVLAGAQTATSVCKVEDGADACSPQHAE